MDNFHITQNFIGNKARFDVSKNIRRLSVAAPDTRRNRA